MIYKRSIKRNLRSTSFNRRRNLLFSQIQKSFLPLLLPIGGIPLSPPTLRRECYQCDYYRDTCMNGFIPKCSCGRGIITV